VSGSCYDSKIKPYYESCTGLATVQLLGLAWSDEFSGSGAVDSAKWKYENGPNPSNQELEYYTDRADNSYVEDGVLKIVAKCENYKGYSYTSARLVTNGIANWGPGHRVHARAKLPAGQGTWPAIWMLPQDNAYGGWPNSGEIDILETVGCTSGKAYGTAHTGAFNHMKNTQKGSNYFTDFTQWHNYTIDWLDSYLKWYVDGNLYYTFSPDVTQVDQWPFNKAFYLILNVAVGGSWGGFCLNGGQPSCSDPNQFGNDQVMEVDFVQVYQLQELQA